MEPGSVGMVNDIKKMIKDRNDKGIMDSVILSEYFPKEKILYYKKFWNSPQLVIDDKRMIWKWLDSFVGISDKYIRAK